MRFISDSEAIFDVEINPYLQTIKVKRIGINDEYIRSYSGIEDCFSHVFGRKYDFHFLYEKKEISYLPDLTFDIYSVNDNNEADYNNPIAYNLDIVVGM